MKLYEWLLRMMDHGSYVVAGDLATLDLYQEGKCKDGDFYSVTIIGAVLVYQDEEKKEQVLMLSKRTGKESEEEFREWEKRREEQLTMLRECRASEWLKRKVRAYRSANGSYYAGPRAALISTLALLTNKPVYEDEFVIEKAADLLAPHLAATDNGGSFPIGKHVILVEEMSIQDLIAKSGNEGYLTFEDQELSAMLAMPEMSRIIEKMVSRHRKYNAPLGTVDPNAPYS